MILNIISWACVHCYIFLKVKLKVTQWCLTLCNPMVCRPTRLPRPWDFPGKGTGVGCHFLPQCVKVKSLSCVQLLRPHGLQPTRLLCPWDFPGKGTGVGCHCLLWLGLVRWILSEIMFVTCPGQGLEPGTVSGYQTLNEPGSVGCSRKFPMTHLCLEKFLETYGIEKLLPPIIFLK